jgi:hypothetical protein
MPNWSNNSILIEGPLEKIHRLWEQAIGDQGLLEAMVPIGEWVYDTAVEAWGTKWDINTDNLHFTDWGNGTATIQGSAESAWSPPIDAFRTYATANQDVYLEIKYFEPGMGFIGVWDSEGNDVYWEGIGELVAQSAENDEDMLMDLFEHFNVWDWYNTDDEEEVTEDQ